MFRKLTPQEKLWLNGMIESEYEIHPHPLTLDNILPLPKNLVAPHDSCFLLSKNAPRKIYYRRDIIASRYRQRKRLGGSGRYARNYRNFLEFLLLHEMGHIRHEQLLERIPEREILQFFLDFPLLSDYKREGWKDIFAETYAIFRSSPELLPAEAKTAFINLIKNLDN